MHTVKSVNGVTMRLPDERWIHITEEHAEMAGYLYDVLETVQEPVEVFEGNEGETGKYIIVVYRELDQEDGFIITSFLTKRWKKIERRKKLWPL